MKTLIFSIVLITAIAFLVYNLNRLLSYLKLAKPEVRWDNFNTRLKHTLRVAFGQKKILRDPIAGPIHAGIFWGFLILMFSAFEAIIQGLVPGVSFEFLGPILTFISISTDLFCTIIFISILVSLWRRYISKVPRLQGDLEEQKDAIIVLGSIFLIVTSLLIEKSAFTIIHSESTWEIHPIGNFIAMLMDPNQASVLYEIGWWIHIVMILVFTNYLPYSKHLHVFTSVQNVFFSPENIPNKLSRIDFEDESIEKYGVSDFEEFTWKTLHDSLTCTHCGRCTSVCPAYMTGKSLDPRMIIVKVRERMMDKGPILLKNQLNSDNGDYQVTDADTKILDKPFIGDYENIEAIWDCTTCGACMQECPVTIEHVPAIVDMRRSLVLMQSEFPQELQSAFQNMENNGSPWAFSQSERTDWAEGLDIKTVSEDPEMDILFWVGCAGAFDDRAKKISRAFSQLMVKAGVNFRILGAEETCNGDPARRMGNEYLADMMVQSNVETLNGYDIKKIVTTCPHCFNTLKNEYPDFGGNFEVKHHTEFLNELIMDGKLKVNNEAIDQSDIAYHDSCYIGRYNQIYDEPRNIISSISGLNVIDPKRSKDKGLCCGAGGGRMWMEESVGKRVNIERTEELLDTGAKTLASNCPFCMTMITDGVKAKDKQDTVEVKDIAEILLENCY